MIPLLTLSLSVPRAAVLATAAAVVIVVVPFSLLMCPRTVFARQADYCLSFLISVAFHV